MYSLTPSNLIINAHQQPPLDMKFGRSSNLQYPRTTLQSAICTNARVLRVLTLDLYLGGSTIKQVKQKKGGGEEEEVHLATHIYT